MPTILRLMLIQNASAVFTSDWWIDDGPRWTDAERAQIEARCALTTPLSAETPAPDELLPTVLRALDKARLKLYVRARGGRAAVPKTGKETFLTLNVEESSEGALQFNEFGELIPDEKYPQLTDGISSFAWWPCKKYPLRPGAELVAPYCNDGQLISPILVGQKMIGMVTHGKCPHCTVKTGSPASQSPPGRPLLRRIRSWLFGC